MSSIQIIVGSMLGGTEYVAEACEEVFQNHNHTIDLHLMPKFSTIIDQSFQDDPSEKVIWLVCTSTHGAGEYPDNLKAFADDLLNTDQDLSTVNFLTIAVGDSSYDTFCKAGKDITKLLISKGCKEINSILTLDMSQEIDPEDLAQQWIETNMDRI
ncbi:flavodoxin domain-containing protein [Colwellia sp. RSH04]|uniref:flavodoxin domain-containing protein n=1 Tax=Colwellia sp. RSH04 TaxID=2305464 RepID=UPI000E5756E7|nr:flavodoxin domain-containing protein [Colwellia sp. RSH04]RHW76515.1 mioC protein [Colwellia sp. RSH04]